MNAHTKNMVENPSSWIIVSRETGEAVAELFSRETVSYLNRRKFKAVPAILYLAGLNEAA